MKRILSDIHTHLRASRAYGGPPVAGNVGNVKRYDRFPCTECSPPTPLSAFLGDVLKTRISRPTHSIAPTLALVGDLFGHSMSISGQHRPYPSGGALYPIEAYVFPFNVQGFSKHSHHYRPDLHAFEQLFPIEHMTSSTLLTTPVHYPAVVVFTALWARSHRKYHDFALELALMETGHIMQNMQLVATALGLSACPMGGFHDTHVGTSLDLDLSHESVMCALAIGEPEVHTLEETASAPNL